MGSVQTGNDSEISDMPLGACMYLYAFSCASLRIANVVTCAAPVLQDS